MSLPLRSHAARVRFLQTGDDSEKGGFSATGGTKQDYEFPSRASSETPRSASLTPNRLVMFSTRMLMSRSHHSASHNPRPPAYEIFLTPSLRPRPILNSREISGSSRGKCQPGKLRNEPKDAAINNYKRTQAPYIHKIKKTYPFSAPTKALGRNIAALPLRTSEPAAWRPRRQRSWRPIESHIA